MTGTPAGGGPIRTTGFIRDADGAPACPRPPATRPPPASSARIGDRIWDDRDGDGIQDAGEAGHRRRDRATDRRSGSRAAPRTTDAAGAYEFGNLLAGRLHRDAWITATVPPEFDLLTTRYPVVVTLRDGEDYDGADVGLKALGTAVGDTLWYDADADGLQDAGEPGLGNVTLDLYFDDGDGVFNPDPRHLVDTTTSDASGAYRLQRAGGRRLLRQRHRSTPASWPVCRTRSARRARADPSPAITLALGQFYRDAGLRLRARARHRATASSATWCGPTATATACAKPGSRS